MQILNTKELTDEQYDFISDYQIIGGWEVLGKEFTINDLKKDEQGNIYMPTDFTESGERYTDHDSHMMIDDTETTWTGYELMITSEELKNI